MCGGNYYGDDDDAGEDHGIFSNSRLGALGEEA